MLVGLNLLCSTQWPQFQCCRWERALQFFLLRGSCTWLDSESCCSCRALVLFALGVALFQHPSLFLFCLCQLNLYPESVCWCNAGAFFSLSVETIESFCLFVQLMVVVVVVVLVFNYRTNYQLPTELRRIGRPGGSASAAGVLSVPIHTLKLCGKSGHVSENHRTASLSACPYWHSSDTSFVRLVDALEENEEEKNSRRVMCEEMATRDNVS